MTLIVVQHGGPKFFGLDVRKFRFDCLGWKLVDGTWLMFVVESRLCQLLNIVSHGLDVRLRELRMHGDQICQDP